ncbi:MAG TPA: hypothetical protein VEH76_07820 [Methylocystis sp.]|nr:hypothetical protein [Methylocystis sp.]
MLNSLYWWLTLFTLLVIVGVIMEGEEIFSELRASGWMRAKHKLAKFGFALLVVGLAGELFFQTRIESEDAKLKRDSDRKIADLRIVAENLRSENLALEAKIAPRKLPPNAIEAIKNVAASFSDRKISLWSYGLDIEGRLLATQIKSAFDAASAPIIDSRGAMISSAVPRVGVIVTGSDEELVSALLKAMQSLSPVRGPVPGAFSAYSLTIPPAEPTVAAEIFVGIKPTDP